MKTDGTAMKTIAILLHPGFQLMSLAASAV